MKKRVAVVTTFPDSMYDVYGKRMIESFVKYWPSAVPILIQLDTDKYVGEISKMLRPNDAVVAGWNKDHLEFVERNKSKDHPSDYRKQAVRFCHKVFAIKRAYDSVMMAKKDGAIDVPDYLIWLDADVITTRMVLPDEVYECLPRDGDAVSYLGRKDWDHSECGWLAFDLNNSGGEIINLAHARYKNDFVFSLEQWHDSWIWDIERVNFKSTNLTADKPGMDIWRHSPMAKWSIHHKGPVAKREMVEPIMPKPNNGSNFVVQTKNAIPAEEICAHIEENQKLIKNWIRPCKPTKAELVVVSAGPQLIAEDVRVEVKAGRKIVAVKHAIEPLRKAGIKPWACILLDPRPHVANFVTDADKDIIWFVASQVNPKVTKALLDKGCTVWGYHASVGAGEGELTKKQIGAIISGGSATATRGLFMLHQLGFSSFRLYGYDLCLPDKPKNMDEKDKDGQPKYVEISLGMNDPLYNVKRCFWTIPELVAQFEEISDIIKNKKFTLKAFGDGIVPFILNSHRVSGLRNKELRDKIIGTNPPTCNELIYGTQSDSRQLRAAGKRKSSRNRGGAS